MNTHHLHFCFFLVLKSFRHDFLQPFLTQLHTDFFHFALESTHARTTRPIRAHPPPTDQRRAAADQRSRCHWSRLIVRTFAPHACAHVNAWPPDQRRAVSLPLTPSSPVLT